MRQVTIAVIIALASAGCVPDGGPSSYSSYSPGYSSSGYSQSSYGHRNEEPEVRIFRDDGFKGRSVRYTDAESDLSRDGFNDQVSSIIIERGRWQFCVDTHFKGRCVTLGPGRYRINEFGLPNDAISSLRPR